MNTEIRSAVEKHGLLFLGVTGLEYAADFERFQDWIRERRHAGLKFLENHSQLRAQPSQLLQGAKAAVIVGMSYGLDGAEPGPQVARYARFPDYHRVLKRKATRAAEEVFRANTFRVTVDSAPILERALAAKTRRGFIGKNTLYIHPEYGSLLLLGEILTTEELPSDTPPTVSLERKTKEGGCGPCQQCQKACPTGALDAAYTLDASLCLSYWTIENRGPIPEKFWPWLSQYYFGCDLCQLACPYNRRSAPPPSDWGKKQYPSIDRVAQMSQAEYETYFRGRPLTGAKRTGLRRNALIAMAVTGHPQLGIALQKARTDGDAVLHRTVEQIERFERKPA